MLEINALAIAAQSDEQALQELISSHQGYILKQASLTSKKYVTTSHDEWSIALQAFAQAIEEYDLEKGHFLSFANLLIRRRLIDFFRGQSKFRAEILVSPATFELAQEPPDEYTSVHSELASKLIITEDVGLKFEIEAIAPVLQTYGFSFFDLIECSPKAQKTKFQCAIAVTYLLQHPLLIHEMHKTGMLPSKSIENHTHLPRKILERHRKYIIAVVEILNGDYPYLSTFLSTMKEGMNK